MWFRCCFGEAFFFFFQQCVTLLSVSQLTHAGRNVKPLPGNKPSFSTFTVGPSEEAVRFTFVTLKVGQLHERTHAHTRTHAHPFIYGPIKPATLTEFACPALKLRRSPQTAALFDMPTCDGGGGSFSVTGHPQVKFRATRGSTVL